MSSFIRVKDLPECLQPLYLTEDSFWNRFFTKSRIQDPFARFYDICDDIFHNNTRVAVKDYSTHSLEQYQNVIDNLSNYHQMETIEELCKLVAFCQEQVSGNIKAAFEYRDYSLQQIIQLATKRLQYQEHSHDFYLLILRQLCQIINNFREISLNLTDLVLTNILIHNHEGIYKFKILYDQRDKKYDLIQEGLKTYSSAIKINTAIQEGSQISENNSEIIFQLGMLLLDISYLYQSKAPVNLGSNCQPLGSSTLFKSYLNFDSYTSCSLNSLLIDKKISYLSGLNSNFISLMVKIIKQMLKQAPQRLTLSELSEQILNLSEIKAKEQKNDRFNFAPLEKRQQQISPIRQRSSSFKMEDSLRYSDSRNELYVKKTIRTQTTVPQSQFIDTREQNDKNNHEFCIIPKQKLLAVNCPKLIKNKLQLFITEVQNKINIHFQELFDKNIYYGELDPVSHQRQGLGIFVYRHGDLYFGVWKQNSIHSGTYIFNNGECFQGTVNKGKQGFGVYYYHNQNIYEGEWQNDLKHGPGKMFYASGDSFEGAWAKGKRNGLGTYFYHNGAIYRGQFLNGKKHGPGTIDFNDGTTLQAHFNANQIEGKGKINYKNGDYFQGIFNFSLKQGEGVYCWEDSIKYHGHFKKDLMQGFAKIHYEGGEYYEGHIFKGKRSGQGLYRYENGDVFKGEWKNDQKVSGQYTYHEGGHFEGKFQQGEMFYGVMVYASGQTYQGQFRNGQRHGFGIYKDAAKVILYDGQWDHDNFLPIN